jgi:hypothetical protein
MAQQSATRVQVINSVELVEPKTKHRLALEWCKYIHSPKDSRFGYRFIWKTPEGKRLAHRGQAMIPSRKIMDKLWDMAEQAGWGDYNSDMAVWGGEVWSSKLGIRL